MFITKIKNIKDLNRFLDDAKSLSSKIEYVARFGESKLRFTLTEGLTVDEDAALEELIANFVDIDPEDKVPSIYDLTKEHSKHFHAINYVKGLSQSLIPKREVVQGEVRQVTWYKDLDAENNLINPILKTDISYTRDSSGFATSRVTTRTWFNRDGSENEEKKITNKYYFINPSDMIDEGLKRRKLLVSSIQIPVLTAMTEVLMPLGHSQEACLLKGRAFMDAYENEFNKFIDNSSTVTDSNDADFGEKVVVVRLRDESDPEYVEWLDESPPSFGGAMTIRQYLINEFNI